jgi:alanine racemase
VTSLPGSGLLRWAEVDVDALQHNAAAFRAHVPRSTELLVMVKSNGYGHGAETAAQAALDGGASWLGVYTPDEALALRAAGFRLPMLVVGWSPPATLRPLIDEDVDITVFDATAISATAAAAVQAGKRARVHVKLDTGLGRLGVREDDLPDVVVALRRAADHVQVAGIFTHYADPEGNADFTQEQHRRFLEGVVTLRPVAPDALLHTSGSAAILNFPEMHHDLVRLGIAFYGYAPREHAATFDVRPAMSVFARVVHVKTVGPGESVGYGRTWWARTPRRIATVAIGYGQGLPRALSNRGHMLVHGRRCLIAGTVNMDQVTVDVSDVDACAPGDEAMFFGHREGARMGADEVADLVDTIAHEVLCGVADWVPRLTIGRRSGPGG